MKRPSGPMVVACIALFAALAGTGYAAKSSGKQQVKKISAQQIKRLVPALADEIIDARAPSLSVARADSAASADKLDGLDASAFALAAGEPVRTIGEPGQPAFQNGWDNVGDPAVVSQAGFYKDSLGMVHLEGTIFAAADNTVAFTLPAGYRPAVDLLLPLGTLAPNEGAGMTVGADGGVVLDCEGVSCSNAGMDGLSFRVP